MGRPDGGFQVAEHSGEVGGVGTAWREASAGGAETPPPILYLHGNPVGSWIWDPFLERTGGIAPDLPGFGRSAKPERFDHSLPGYADFLERFADARALDRFSLVVHDIGGPIGCEWAVRHPDRVLSLTALNTLLDLTTFRRP